MMTKNEIARLRKVQTNLHAILDQAHMAQGTLYPEGLRQFRDGVSKVIRQTQELLDRIKLPPTAGKRASVVPSESLDLDDFDEPEQTDTAA